ncbi:SDR family NAD(P)-dependent oxidoreductase [Thalassotalea litorea]|uniref:SDR family NAD(P)-dependent oxidoreductase n=1 Tax=Thalassotalea litorea TaxID=2020715 RepID=A0A5R9IT83_9GAMM|nr:SDR family NAD(P)-dependent oxidoreductase [Thalassotalea litorea]TLU65128.1 SDR family NAD(P)-dependent oxidoreductase [Thalassotalea litorea]
MATTLIIGASSAIAKAIADSVANCNTDTSSIVAVPNEKLSVDSAQDTVLRISRSSLPAIKPEYCDTGRLVNVIDLPCDYSPAQIQQCCDTILEHHQAIDTIYICNGVLHGNLQTEQNSRSFYPEKKIEDLDLQTLQHVMTTNAFMPALWLQNLTALFALKHPCKVICFSARVGSISDNHLGGWYSYRASKAALNMLLKTMSIEFSRRFKNVKLIAFHPGTTDSRLSEPFQANVPKERLFSPEFVSQQLIDIVESLDFDGELSYVDWDNKTIHF